MAHPSGQTSEKQSGDGFFDTIPVFLFFLQPKGRTPTSKMCKVFMTRHLCGHIGYMGRKKCPQFLAKVAPCFGPTDEPIEKAMDDLCPGCESMGVVIAK